MPRRVSNRYGKSRYPFRRWDMPTMPKVFQYESPLAPMMERLVREKLGIDYSSIRPFSYGRLCQTFDDAFPGKAVIHAPIPGPREMASFPGRPSHPS